MNFLGYILAALGYGILFILTIALVFSPIALIVILIKALKKHYQLKERELDIMQQQLYNQQFSKQKE